MNKNVVFLDIDGVLADFEGKFQKVFGSDNRHLYSLENRFGNSRNREIHEFVTSPATYKDLEVIPEGADLYHLFAGLGAKIIFVTARSSNVRDVTLRWLCSNGFREYSNSLTIFSVDKYLPAKKYDPMLVVDDSPATVRSLVEKNIPAVLFDQEWNRDRSTAGLFRIKKEDIDGMQTYDDFLGRLTRLNY